MLLLLTLACDPVESYSPVFLEQPQPDAPVDTDWPVSYNGPAYEPCVSDAQCGPGSACDRVPGFAGSYCALPCEADGDGLECDLDGTLTFDTTCLSNGRCARLCEGESDDTAGDSCPDTLACQAFGGMELCAGEPFGTSGNYGTCSHPNVSGTDCPPESSCFGGDYVGTDSGVCLPWCDLDACPTPPDGTSNVTPICYDVGFEHPLCPLLCTVGNSSCPEGQECLDLGFAGICAPEGSESPL